MSSAAASPLAFKFYWLDEEGNQTGFLRKKGYFDGEILTLDDVEIPVVLVLDVQFRENRLALILPPPEPAEDNGEEDGEGNEEPVFLGIMLSGGTAPRDLKLALDVSRSVQWAELHREQLRTEGREAAYREERCSACGATLILTDMERTPQLYCHFCDTLATLNGPPELFREERQLRQCEECGMFARPRKFTLFYFWFLLFVYGWKRGTFHSCPACMRGEAWKMLFANLLFLIGLPNAVLQLIRSYTGTIRSGPFAGLDTANQRARRGDLAGALDIYRDILHLVPHSAGLKYNIGLALLNQEETARAAESFELALQDCSNYVPAYQALTLCYEILGETEKNKELQRVWSGQEEETTPAAAGWNENSVVDRDGTSAAGGEADTTDDF